MTLTVAGNAATVYDHGTGETQHFTGDGRLTKITDRNDNATTLTYDADGALTSIRSDVGGAGAGTLTFTSEGTGPGGFANGVGRITTISQTPDGGGATRTITLSYGANGYLDGVTDAAGRSTELFSGAQGNLNRITAPGGAATSFGYDTYGRVQTITQPTASSGTGAVTRFAYPAGQTLVAEPNSDQNQPVSNAARTTYQLTDDGLLRVASATDPAGHLRSATYTPFLDVASATNPAGTTTAGYDEAVNGGESLTSVTSATGAGSSFAYANTAQATRYQASSATDAQGRTSTYSYNSTGNRTGTSNASSVAATVTYNGDGTVATATSPTGAVISYGYDSHGLRFPRDRGGISYKG
ncbi:hypothetical protein [Trujillonella humicola]|uniref:hypothetical protein n=1 Tax=Trujillonella humicola TaxID=3383699 RepID=UPI0039059CEB